MTCPFYVCDGRPSCALGEPDGRHCGPRQYPVGPCNLDAIGRGDAWRAALAIFAPIAEYYGDWPFCVGSMLRSHGTAPMTIASDGDYALDAVGWSP